jgi:hypothetical protein
MLGITSAYTGSHSTPGQSNQKNNEWWQIVAGLAFGADAGAGARIRLGPDHLESHGVRHTSCAGSPMATRRQLCMGILRELARLKRSTR